MTNLHKLNSLLHFLLDSSTLHRDNIHICPYKGVLIYLDNMNIQEKKNIVLFVGKAGKAIAQTFVDFKKNQNEKYRIAIIYPNVKNISEDQKASLEMFDIAIPANFESSKSIQEALLPYNKELVAVTSRSEPNIPYFQEIIPHVPYLRTPTVKSLEWATNKIEMRRRFKTYNKKITPEYMVVHDVKKETIKKIEEKVGYPLVIKPSGLAQSLLVNLVFHQDELKRELNKVFRKIRSVYKDAHGRGEALVLVEQFMDGDMYSVDAYVTSRGKVYCCPPVGVKTGRTIGFDDFFGYQRIVPTLLNKQSVDDAYSVCEDAVHAIGLRSSTAHIELMKTEKGWKVIELGPRPGGFRHDMYALSYGIDHNANDIFIRIPKPVVIPRTVLGHTSVLQFFAKNEGYITSISGTKRSQELKSLKKIKINKSVGSKAKYAKNGGKSIIDVTMFNNNRSELLADIRRLESLIKIETSKKAPKRQ